MDSFGSFFALVRFTRMPLFEPFNSANNQKNLDLVHPFTDSLLIQSCPHMLPELYSCPFLCMIQKDNFPDDETKSSVRLFLHFMMSGEEMSPSVKEGEKIKH